MTHEGIRRGRPIGDGMDDSEMLAAVDKLMADNQQMSARAATLHLTDRKASETEIRRWHRKRRRDNMQRQAKVVEVSAQAGRAEVQRAVAEARHVAGDLFKHAAVIGKYPATRTIFEFLNDPAFQRAMELQSSPAMQRIWLLQNSPKMDAFRRIAEKAAEIQQSAFAAAGLRTIG